jgi:hypothetical protein
MCSAYGANVFTEILQLLPVMYRRLVFLSLSQEIKIVLASYLKRSKGWWFLQRVLASAGTRPAGDGVSEV